MKIEFPFEIGDPLNYVETYAAANRDGVAMAEILCDHGYEVDGIQYTEDGLMILSDGDPQVPGSQYACLSAAQAMSWLLENAPGSLLLTRAKTVDAVFIDEYGNRSIVKITDCSVDLEEYVYEPKCGQLDRAGYAAIYDPTAKQTGSAISMFLLDESGNPVDAMYGPFLLVRLALREDGLYELIDVDKDVLPGKHLEQMTKEERTAYSPSYRTQLKSMSLEQFCASLQERYPKDATVNVSGTDTFYAHYSPASNQLCLDASDLADLPEYENLQD